MIHICSCLIYNVNKDDFISLNKKLIKSMYLKCTWILCQGKNMVAFMKLVYWFIGQFFTPVRGEGMRKKGKNGGIFILARCEFHFVREHENLM